MSPCRIIACLIVCAALIGVEARAQCAIGGALGPPTISFSSNLVDSNTRFTIENAPPMTNWLGIADVTAGPTSTGFGFDICAGPAPLIVFNSFNGAVPLTGATGRASVPIVITPSFGAVIGTTFFIQGVTVDFTAPANIGLSDSLPFTLESPMVGIVSDSGGTDAVDLLETRAILPGGTPALHDTISMQGVGDFAFSPDGRRIYTRDISPTLPDRVRCFDISAAPATLLGQATLGATGSNGNAGIVISADGADGYIVDSTNMAHRFDADPSSVTFMQITGSATVSLAGPENLVISPDGGRLYVCGATDGLFVPSVVCVVDTATMLQTATIPLIDALPLALGVAIRTPIAMSGDGDLLAVIQVGLSFGIPGLNASGGVNVIDTDPGSATFNQRVNSFTLTGFGQQQCCFDPTDSSNLTLLTVDSNSTGTVRLAEINLATGAVTAHALGVAAGGNGSEEGGIATTPNGANIVVATKADDAVRVLDSGFNVLSGFPLPTSGGPGRVHIERR